MIFAPFSGSLRLMLGAQRHQAGHFRSSARRISLVAELGLGEIAHLERLATGELRRGERMKIDFRRQWPCCSFSWCASHARRLTDKSGVAKRRYLGRPAWPTRNDVPNTSLCGPWRQTAPDLWLWDRLAKRHHTPPQSWFPSAGEPRGPRKSQARRVPSAAGSSPAVVRSMSTSTRRPPGFSARATSASARPGSGT